MKKTKYIIGILFIAIMLCVVPNISNAATEYTYSDTEQGIEWGYEIDASNNVVNLKCKTTDVKGALTIPSTIDGKKVISLYELQYLGSGGERSIQKLYRNNKCYNPQ